MSTKKIWTDPVWASVIATLIASAILALFSPLQCQNQQNDKDISEKKDTFKLFSEADEVEYITDKIEGDFDGDGKKDKAWLIKTFDENAIDLEIEDVNFSCFVKFSTNKIPIIKSENCSGGIILYNEGDLNDDGRDDLAIIFSGMHSVWKGVSVYSYTKDNSWKPIAKFVINIDFGINFSDRIQKQKKGSFYILEDNAIDFETTKKEIRVE